jgi:ribose transport system substrate-binding protein
MTVPVTRRKARTFLLLGAVSLLPLAGLAACSSTPAATAPSEVVSPEATAPEAGVDIAALREPFLDYTLPDGPIEGVAELAASEVWYIPNSMQFPYFQVEATMLEESLAEAGITLSTCSGENSPTGVSACFDQAIGAGAAAIVGSGYGPNFAATAFELAAEKGIPVQLLNWEPEQHDDWGDDVLAYNAQLIQGTNAAADWAISDAGGDTTILTVAKADPSNIAEMTVTRKYIEAECPGCTVVEISVKSQDVATLPSLVSAELIKNPDIAYVIPQQPFMNQSVAAGIQTAGTTSVKLVIAEGLVGDLQNLEQANGVAAVVAKNRPYAIWQATDQLLRMVTGSDLSAWTPELATLRVFDETNIADITLDDTSELSAAWHGGDDFKASFLELWGLN